jgi:hypothetical protein
MMVLSLTRHRLSAAKRVILIGHGPGVLGISELLEARSEHKSDPSLRAHALRCLFSRRRDAPCETCCSGCRLYQDPSRPKERTRLNHLVPEGTWMRLLLVSDTR